jgi:hypothetical protein
LTPPPKATFPPLGKSLPQNGHEFAETSSATSSSAGSPLRLFHPQDEAPTDFMTDDAIIARFEPLLLHCPRNIRILTTLGEAYARKMMFDKSLSFYQRAQQIEGGKRAEIEKAISDMTLKKLDLELIQLDPTSPKFAAERERLQNQRVEYQWQEMEKGS